MKNIQVYLSEEQSKDLKQYIYTIAKEGIEEAKRNANLDQPLLKQKYMAEYLGISVNSLKKLELEGLPSVTLDGLKLYSKDEAVKWILGHQK